MQSDSLLGRALATRRNFGEAAPDYVRLLNAIARSGDASLSFEKALAHLDNVSIDEVAQELLNAVVVAAMESTMPPRLPKRRAVSEASYRELFAALELLGNHFGVEEFPQVSDEPKLDVSDVDSILRSAVMVYRVALGLEEATFEDKFSLGLLAAVRYKLKEAPLALSAMWKHLKIEKNATLVGLGVPKDSEGFNRIGSCWKNESYPRVMPLRPIS